jgi:hypothetical protein
MPTRKQRRRRQKDRRHEYEYVYVDDEGREVEVEDEPAPAKKGGKDAGKATKASGRGSTRGEQKIGAGRKVNPPSWNRVLKRGAIFAPVMLIVIYLLKPKNMTTPGLIVQLCVLLLFFLPFSYMMDSLMYRSYRKRIGDPIPPRERKPRAPRP